MKILAVCLLVCLVCAVTAQSGAAANHELAKRAASCPRYWTEFNGRCYRYIPRSMTWVRAEKKCRSMKATLASVHDMEEYHMIQGLIMAVSHSYEQTWIGGSDAQEEGHWMWTDGSPLDYTNWCPGEPNNHRGRQHCLRMNHSGGKCWDDFYCSSGFPFVCAKRM